MAEISKIMTRTLHLAAPANDRLLGQIRNTPGVAGLRLGSGGQRLEVDYDIARIDFGTLATLFSAAGLKPSNGLFARLKRHWVAFQERNERDQSKIVHQCCNIPPARK